MKLKKIKKKIRLFLGVFQTLWNFKIRGIEYSDAEELQTSEEAFDRFYASFSKSPHPYLCMISKSKNFFYKVYYCIELE